MKPKTKKILTSIKNILIVLLGNFFFALSVVVFIIPANVMATGITGVALAVNHITGFSVSICITHGRDAKSFSISSFHSAPTEAAGI